MITHDHLHEAIEFVAYFWIAFGMLGALIANESMRVGVKLKDIKGLAFTYKSLEPHIREDRKKAVRFFVTSSNVLFFVLLILYSLSALLYHLQKNQV